MALGTPVAAAVAYSASGGTTVSPAYPSGILATDEVLMIVGQKPTTTTGGTVSTPGNWTLLDSLTAAGGYAAQGADTGNTNLFIYKWDTVVAGQTGNLSVTIGGNDVTWAFMIRVPTGGSVSYGWADGQRTTTPTSPMTVALTNGSTATDFQAGDLAIWAMCIPTDVTTPNQFSAHSISASGATFATAVEFNEPDSQTGNDIGGFSAYASVSSGSSTAAPSITVTLAGTLTNVRGPVVLVRIRETVQPLTPSLYTNSQTFYGPTVTPGTATLAPALYTNGQTFYGPTITQSGGAVDLQPSLYTNTQTFYSATVSASNTLTPGLYTNGQTFYGPTVSSTYALAPSLYTNNQTFYGPVVSQAGGTQTLVPDLYTNAQAFYSPAVAATNTLAPALYTNAQSFYAPSITTTRNLTPGLYTNSQTFYPATVSNGATTQHITIEDYVDVGYVAPDYVTWVASFQAGNQFFPAALLQEPQRGESWMPQMDTKLRKRIQREREQKDELRRLIVEAIDPVVEQAQPVAVVPSGKKSVKVVRAQGAPISIPVLPAFNAAEVTQAVMEVLEQAKVEATRVQKMRDAQKAVEAARENLRRVMRRRKDDEFLLLMG